METKEEWRDVVDYEGIYQVSDMGRVRSLDRITSHGHKRKGKALKPGTGSRGYEHVDLSKVGSASTKNVHQLVALAFIGPRLDDLVVDHIDNDKLNNRVENLQYISNRLNCSKDIKRDLPTGVHRKGAKYQARIWIDVKQVTLGYFDTPEQASEVYLRKLLTLGR